MNIVANVTSTAKTIPMQPIIKRGTLLFFGAMSAFSAYSQKSVRPNVLLIYVDDLGSVDLNCYGSKDLITPNIDKLAREGVRFTQFYGAPSSSPSRASLMTGMFTSRAGLTNNASDTKGLPEDRTTIAQVMKGANYATALIGKWHLGATPQLHPNARGFDYFWGHLGGCVDNYSNFFYWAGPNRHDLWCNDKEIWRDGDFYPASQVKELQNYVRGHIKKSPDQPFFIYWASNLPHYPLQATQKWRDAYKDVPNPRGMYGAFVSTLDELVGDVMTFLEKEGLKDNTIVIFQSDNGHSREVRNFSGGGSAGQYRGAKFSLFEGGIRMPAIISYPKTLPQNQVRDQIAMNIDWLPTIADMCGIKVDLQAIDGRSLIPVIKSANAASQHDVLYFDSGKQWAVRKGDWKLSGNPIDPLGDNQRPCEDVIYLTNLKMDISESKNLAANYPDVVRELSALREEYLKSLNK